ncbi:MAG TPA: NmrA/HSCARG family protein [Longimicrobiales bacterium]
MAEQKQVLVVVGATGAQGGGVARAALADGRYHVRAVTRKPESEKAQALRAAGAEVVAADLDDVESLVSAFAGAQRAFFVTNYWELYSPERELQQAENLAEAARRAGLQHVVWSTLEDTRTQVPLDDEERYPTLMGKYKVPHFDAKGEADRYFSERGVPTTFLRASFYFDNFVYFGSGPKRAADGVLELILPMGDKVMPGVAAEDIGGVAYGILLRGAELIGQTVGVAGEHLTGRQYAEKMGKALGEEVRYAPVTPAQFRAFGFPGADDLGNMFQYYQDFERELSEVRSVERSRQLYARLQSFDQWLEKYASQMPIEQAV